MKLFIPVFSVVLFFSSCTTFQYLTVNSTALSYAGEKFTNNKDSLEIGYQFSGHNAELQLFIKNNGSGPVTVDWKRSALITNGVTVSLFNAVIPIKADARYDTAQHTAVIRQATITGTAVVPGETDFIPPFSSLYKKTVKGISQPLGINIDYNETVVKENSLQQKMKLPGKTFTSENSPCKIRVYITYTAADGQSRVIEDAFFISELFETTKAPETIRELFGKTQAVVYTF